MPPNYRCRNPDKPFAFLATYTEGQGKTGTLQHIPLAEALMQSIAAKDSKQFEVLLAPFSRAAQESSLIKDLLESRTLFSPQASQENGREEVSRSTM